MLIALVVVLWLILGFLAYGACIADFAEFGPTSPGTRALAIVVFLMGFLGFLTAFMATWVDQGAPFGAGFQWRAVKSDN